MALHADLTALREQLSSRLGGLVAVGRPDDAVQGVYIWPWRIIHDSVWLNRLPHAGEQRPPPTFIIHFLLLATPGNSLEALAQLERAQQAIYESPILPADGSEVLLECLDASDLTALFIAARLELVPCFSYVIRPRS